MPGLKDKKKNHFEFGSEFSDAVIRQCEGFLSAAEMDALFELLKMEADKHHFNRESENNFLRLLSAVIDRAGFLKELISFPHRAEILITLVSNSNYLTDICVRNPEYLYQVFNPEYLRQPIGDEKLNDEIGDGISRFRTYHARINFLRLFKRRVILKIGICDLLGMYQLTEVTEKLSVLANSVLRKMFELSYVQILTKYKCDEPDVEYCVASLGKLGGGELNYSSDVDLLVFYESNEILEECDVEYHQILSETIQLFTKAATETTLKGYVYRVDFRLRPDGKHSPLCRTINDFIKYYEARGEPWERQMLIKLGFTAGSLPLYDQFKKYLNSFVFPASFSSSPLSEVKKMKKNIEEHLSEQADIKRSPGGIRDIEFSVQALQMINGGRFAGLKTGNTLTAIDALLGEQILSKNEAESFSSAYIFYRKIEHYLQLMNDRQTHALPQEGEIVSKIARFLGFNSDSDLQNKITEFRSKVRTIYNSIVDEKPDEAVAEGEATTQEIQFTDRRRADRNFDFLQFGRGVVDKKEFDRRTGELFQQIEPLLIKVLSGASNPDETLENFCSIVRNSYLPSILYSELRDEKYFENVLRICSYSRRAIEYTKLTRKSNELLISRKVFSSNFDELFDSLSLIELLFLLSVQYALRLLPQTKVSQILADFISQIISEVIRVSNLSHSFFIAGMGSFGTREMHFGSDLDLLIVASDSNAPNLQEDFQTVVRKLTEALKPFSVDFRLRPEGKTSQLVWDLGAYKKYFQTRARTWEFQALSKCRFISGSSELYNQFMSSYFERISNIDIQQVKSEMLQMYRQIRKSAGSRQKTVIDLKTGSGAKLDIDFIVHCKLFENPELIKKTAGKDFVEKLKVVCTTNKNSLLVNYLFIKDAEAAQQNLFNSESSVLPTDEKKLNLLSEFLGFGDGTEFLNKIRHTFGYNRALFKEIFEGE